MVVTGVFTQLVGWGTFYAGAAVIVVGASEGGIGAVHAVPPGGIMMGMGGTLIYQGGVAIYEGFAELDNTGK